MTVVGNATDEIARDYERFLRAGEGGAYLAMAGTQDAVLEAATSTGIAAEPLNGPREAHGVWLVLPALPQ